MPLRVTHEDPAGRLLYQGDTINVGAGGVYFRTLNWQDIRPGMAVHVTIDIPPGLLQLLPFGGLRGFGEVIRIDGPRPGTTDSSVPDDASSLPHGVAIRMTSRLRFDPELHLPRFESHRKKPN
jgi:hypothetical protein